MFSTSELKTQGGRKNLTKRDEGNIIRAVNLLRILLDPSREITQNRRWHPQYNFNLNHTRSTSPTWLPLSIITQERYVDKQRRLQKSEVCSTNETLITLLLETLHKFRL